MSDFHPGIHPMPHPSWSGFIRLSLVSVPVKGFTALGSEKAPISFNQLHEVCHSRIQYKKTCPIHGEVSNDEIVKGYQYKPDHYAIIDPDEINQLRSEADRSINVDKFVRLDQIDPVYFSGQTYYLVPDGRQGEKAYAVLQRAMSEDEVCGLAQVVITNREQLVLLRTIGRLLLASVLHYAAEIRSADTFEEDLGDGSPSAAEVKLAKTLIQTVRAKEPELDDYQDLYNDKLQALVEAKIAGKEIAATPTEEHRTPVVNFMEALKASLQKNKSGAGKKLAPSNRARERAPTKRRRSG
jgi:DNA end-binding protein Ku